MDLEYKFLSTLAHASLGGDVVTVTPASSTMLLRGMHQPRVLASSPTGEFFVLFSGYGTSFANVVAGGVV